MANDLRFECPNCGQHLAVEERGAGMTVNCNDRFPGAHGAWILSFCSPHGNDKNDLRDQIHRERVYRPLQFHERSQHLIGANDEALSVTMRVHNPDRSPFAIER